jgi:hypothetical protein
MACKLDRHPRRDELDRAMVNGVDYRTICATFGASLGTLNRHKSCIKELLREAIQSGQAERGEQGSNLLARVEQLITTTEEILATAKTDKDLKAATNAVGAITRLLELLGRLDGSLMQSGGPGLHLHLSKTVNVTNNYGSDEEIALLVAEATAGFDPAVISRFKQLAESAITQP